MKLSTLAATVALAPAYANAGTAPNPVAAPAAKKTPTKRAEPMLTEIATDIAIPTDIKTGSRGSKSPYPFDTLAVGASFGIKNKSAKSMSSIVSNQNRKASNQAPVLDAEGKPTFETKEVKDANGVVVSTIPDTEKPITKAIKHFVVADVNPKTDPAGASVRIWRKQ